MFRLPFFHDFLAEYAFIPETVDFVLCALGEIVGQEPANVAHLALVLHSRDHFQHLDLEGGEGGVCLRRGLYHVLFSYGFVAAKIQSFC